MKKRYLFPLVYIALFLLSFIFPMLDGILWMFFEIVVSLIVLAVVVTFDLPKNSITYFVVLGTILQFFLLGYLWDLIAEKINNRKYKD